MTDLSGLKGGGESCEATTYDKYAVASHSIPPRALKLKAIKMNRMAQA
jgi:hypothetical protein